MNNVKKGPQSITFRIVAPNATTVCLGGDFNGWEPQKYPLEKRAGGIWEKTLMLPPGRYEYRYVVDGNWWHDPSNAMICFSSTGAQNAVIQVGSDGVDDPENDLLLKATSVL